MGSQNLLDKMEKKLSRYAISNITLYLIICYAFGYAIELINPLFLNYLTLEPAKILQGQIWRLITWVIVPPSSSNLFFVLIMLYFYYSVGRSLEHVWGTYKLNVYLFSGIIFTIIGAFLLWAITSLMGYGGMVGFGYFFSTYYINMSLFLAYAFTFPDMYVMLFFILPIKVRALGIIYIILMVVSIIQGGLVTGIVIISSLLNFAIFFLLYRRSFRRSTKQIKRQMEYKANVHRAESTKIAKHKCAVCGRTSDTNPELQFRFCSKCNGNYEYCEDHLFTHEHVK
ncbi:rhomboid family intramembrane serine protease [Lacrimispora saccharolytica]|uniref:rhomboid family intramembrane serine protease n=1 Tax=Lacrimispora saccharolytica TaxID=84030 RepID=UPI00265C9487|nr:hypothetical protein [Lacrimispora saccharolytica]MCF2656336.1 hypothetical protein [Lacrimispora saccharolytica]